MSDFKTLDNFLAAYFHQDWTLDHDTPEAVVDDYVRGESAATVVQLGDELDRLLAQAPDETSLATLLRDSGCEYDPTRDGHSHADWLRAVRTRLTG